MLNCKQATALISQRMDRDLPLSQRAGLRFHLMMCSGCRNYNRQMNFLRQACRKISREN